MILEGSKGDKVTAAGVDTRGHKVTRSGVLLDEARLVNAQRSGITVSAWRVCVGQEGDDPAVRGTWVTLFPDSAESWCKVDDQEAPEVEWTKLRMSNLVNWSEKPSYFRYGGSAKREADPNGPMVRLLWSESKRGTNNLVSVETGEVVAKVHSQSMVWAVRATPEEIEAMPDVPELLHDDEGQDDGIEWKHTQVRDVSSQPVFLYGGREEKPGEPVKVWAGWTGDGIALRDPKSKKLIANLPVDAQIWWAPVPQPSKDEQPPRKAVRPGVLFEGWVTDHRSGPGAVVVSMDRKRQIGWLTPDHRFVPVGV